MTRPVSDVARRAAKEVGLKRYFGATCAACGGTERFTSSRMCVVCLPKKTQRWKAQNVEHIRLYAHNYELRNAATIDEQRKRYRVEHAEERRAVCRLWKKNNPDRNTAHQMRRQAAQLHRTPPWLTQAHGAEIDGMYHFAMLMSRITGRKYHVDHIVPLQGKTVSGLHAPWNLQAISALDNQRKSNSLVV